MKPERMFHHHHHECLKESTRPLACGPPAYTVAVARRNERERNRVQLVNHGFNALRQHVPQSGQKKLSKVETLRSAVDYIRELQELLELTRARQEVTDATEYCPPKENRAPRGGCRVSLLDSASSPGSSSGSSTDGRSGGTPGPEGQMMPNGCRSSSGDECTPQEQDALWELASWWPVS